MNICLIGNGLSTLILATILANRNIKVSIFEEYKPKINFTTRTLAVSKNNFEYLKKEKINVEKISWPINKIKIYNGLKNNKEILNFGSNSDKIFYNKSGYTFYRRNRTYDLDEEDMREILKKSIYNLENLDDELRNFLIDKTKIKINIIHPNRNKNHSCSGNIADFELR